MRNGLINSLSLALSLLVAGGAEASKVFIEKPVEPRASDAKPLVFEPIPLEVLEFLGARLVAEHDTRVLVEVPEEDMEGFLERVQTRGYGFSLRSDFDRIRMNGFDFDSVGGRPEIPPDLEIEDYDEVIGLYLIQMIGPPKPEWIEEIREHGTIIRYFAENTFLVRAPTGTLVHLQDDPRIQYLGIHQPAFKIQPSLLSLGEEMVSVVIQMDESRDAGVLENGIEKALGLGVSIPRSGPFANVRLTLAGSQINALAKRPEVLWVEAYVGPAPSDERHAMVIADQITGSRPNPPATGPRYENWLGSKGFCVSTTFGSCIDYDTKVAVFDTGLDSNTCSWGLSDPMAYDPVQGTCSTPWVKNRHPDFGGNGLGSRQTNFFCIQETIDPNANPPVPDFCNSGDVEVLRCSGYNPYLSEYYLSFDDDVDDVWHGTSVASLAVGSAFEGGYDQDGEGYFEGWGIAPSARLVTTKVLFSGSAGNFGSTEYQCMMSRTRRVGAKFANNSWNQQKGVWDPFADETGYSFLSQLMDSLVRDADPYDQNLIEPETIVFSAGNLGEVIHNPNALVQAPANAKNVISVGGSEGWQGENEVRPCCSQFSGSGCHSCTEEGGDDVGNIFGLSLRSTEDGRIKPDLVAPGTRLRAALSMDENSSGTYKCFGGTSGAAPLVTGSAVLVDAWLQANYAPWAPSPAMLKAMLVAHAADLQGGKDWLPKVAGFAPDYVPIEHSPSGPQGWGRVDLDTLIPDGGGVPAGRWFLDEDHRTVGVERRFSGPLISWSENLNVIDSNNDVIVVLAYTDAAGALGASNAAVNNLNLTVIDGGGLRANRYLGNNFIPGSKYSKRYGLGFFFAQDLLNNVEVIRIPPNEIVNDDFSVLISAETLGAVGVPGLDGGAFNQDFAIYIVNAQPAGGGQ